MAEIGGGFFDMEMVRSKPERDARTTVGESLLDNGTELIERCGSRTWKDEWKERRDDWKLER